MSSRSLVYLCPNQNTRVTATKTLNNGADRVVCFFLLVSNYLPNGALPVFTFSELRYATLECKVNVARPLSDAMRV